jgi:putative SbcD/Mre11-related phosphoesterase
MSHLERLLDRTGASVELVDRFDAGDHLLVHGDNDVEIGEQTRVIMGHEHPAVRLNDGVATSLKCPCFLVNERVVVLPAFSSWAAGSPVGDGEFLSPIARRTQFSKAVAIVGPRLLSLPLQ